MLDVDWSLGIPLVLHDGDMAGFHAPGLEFDLGGADGETLEVREGQ